MSNFRIERDTFGNIEVPAHRLWGAQTQRSIMNFKFPGETMPLEVVRAQALVKRAAASVNMALKVLDRKKGEAIVAAADEVLAGKHDAEFPPGGVADGFGHADQYERKRGAGEPCL